MANKAPNKNKRTIGVSIRIHPLALLVIGFLVVFFLMGWLSNSGGSNQQKLTVNEFMRSLETNQYSRVDIRNNGQVLAQAKYIYIAPISDNTTITILPQVLAFEQKDLKELSLTEMVDSIKPKDPITQLRDILTRSNNPQIVELVFGNDSIVGLTSGKTIYLVRNVSEKQFNDQLVNLNIQFANLNIIKSKLESAAERLSMQDLQARVSSGLISYLYELDGQIYARVATNKIPTYYIDWDVTITAFTRTLQDEGVKLSDSSFVLDAVIVNSIALGDILSILSLAGLVVLGIFLFRGIQSSGSSLSRFGQSRARMFWGEKQNITFADVAGIDEAKEELTEIVQFLKNPEKFRKLGARIPKGVLMVGPPGTGKTLMARAIAGEAGVPFFHTSGSEFEEMLVGAGASRVRDLFEKAKKAAPALIFIDEIDAVARKRGTTIQSSTTEQTLNQILVEMDGFEQNLDVIVIAATNRPDVLDPAILRPGRFDRRVFLELPDAEGRKKILQIHSQNKPLGPDVILDKLAKRTIGFSGAELENTLNEAAIIAAKRGAKEISYLDIEEAASKVMMGPAKTSRKRDDYTLKLVAYHEAGHAVVSKFVPQANPVHRVSIISRGGAGGVTEFLPLDENMITSRTKLLSHLAVALGGRAAEEIFMDDVSTGASNDISQATNIVRNMVQKYGMSEKLGLIKYGDSADLEHLGYGYGENKEYSEETAKIIDEEVRRIMNEAYAKAKDVLTKQRTKVDDLVKMLLEKEVVEDHEFNSLFEDKKAESSDLKD